MKKYFAVESGPIAKTFRVDEHEDPDRAVQVKPKLTLEKVAEIAEIARKTMFNPPKPIEKPIEPTGPKNWNEARQMSREKHLQTFQDQFIYHVPGSKSNQSRPKIYSDITF